LLKVFDVLLDLSKISLHRFADLAKHFDHGVDLLLDVVGMGLADLSIVFLEEVAMVVLNFILTELF